MESVTPADEATPTCIRQTFPEKFVDCYAPAKADDTDSDAMNDPSGKYLIGDTTTVASLGGMRSEKNTEGCPAAVGMPSKSCFESNVYNLLVSDAARADAGILFAWWPRAHAWNVAQLVERTTRCLPAVRPVLDRVALPDISEVHDMWESWSSLHGLGSDQAIWFPPLLDDSMVPDAASATCCMVLKTMSAENDLDRPCCIYPMYMTKTIEAEAALYSLHVIGDPEDHALMPLSSAKAWMHPRITGGDGPATSSLRDVLLPSLLRVRGPYGYVACTLDDLHTAWVRLLRECPPGTRLVLKPSNGSGGCGVILDASEADLVDFDFVSGVSAILEEMVVGHELVQSPTLYMIGDKPCGLLSDQVLSKDGTRNLGNKYPSTWRADLFPVCVAAAHAVNKIWCLKANWGLDFVLNADGIPIIVDLNMGRPNGNLAVRMWASRCSQPLSLYTSSWLVPPNGPSIHHLTDALRSEDLLWNGSEGAIVYQHAVACECSYAVASSFGYGAVQDILSKLATLMLKRFGINMN
jgi:hypothetical protein